MRHSQLLVALSLLFTALPSRGAEPSQLRIDARTLAEREGVVIVDLRGGDAYRAAHLPQALHWKPDGCSAADASRASACLARLGIDGEKPLVAYDEIGAPSPEAGFFLWLAESAGAPSVAFLAGGVRAWVQAGLQLEEGPPPPGKPPVASSLFPSEPATVEAWWLLPQLGRPGVEILDLREGTGWRDFSIPPIFRTGHVPYALPFAIEDLLGPEEGWPDVEAGRATLGSLGPRPGDPVSLSATFVLYGVDENDPGAHLAYLLFSHLGIDARMLAGGFAGWRDQGRPLVRVLTTEQVLEQIEGSLEAGATDTPIQPLVIDLREVRDYGLGHLPSAVALPLHRFEAEFETMLEEERPGASHTSIPLIFYCYGPDCVRSRKAGAWAAALGYTDISWFRGGTEAWRETGLPLHRRPATDEEPTEPTPVREPGSERR